MLNRKSNPSSPRWSSRLYASLYALVTAIYRKRPVWMVSFSTSEANLSEGLRAACASTAMLVLGNLLHDPAFAWAAIGAFWTCLADAAGSNRARFASMMGFALLSTVCGGVTAFASGEGTVFAALAHSDIHDARRVRQDLGRRDIAGDDSRGDRLRRDGRPADAQPSAKGWRFSASIWPDACSPSC